MTKCQHIGACPCSDFEFEREVEQQVSRLNDYPTAAMADAVGDAWSELTSDESLAFVEIVISALRERIAKGFNNYEQHTESACMKIVEKFDAAVLNEAVKAARKQLKQDAEDAAIDEYESRQAA